MAPSPATLRDLALAAELDRLAAAFSDAGVDLVVLKGVPLTLELHGALGGRHMVDNDLLVRRRDATRAALLLRELGYRDRPDRSFESELAHGHEFAFVRSDVAPTLVVDLHWAPWDHHRHPFEESALWARTRWYLLRGGTRVRVLDPAMTVVHLAGHYAQHRFAEPRIIDDLARAWERWDGPAMRAEIDALARAVGLAAALAYGLGVAARCGKIDGHGVRVGRRVQLVQRLWPHGRSRPHSANRPDHLGMGLSLLLLPPRSALRSLRAMAFPPVDTVGDLRSRPPSVRRTVRYVLRPLRPLGRRLGLTPRWF